jgi:hypothetical protein
MKLKQQQKRLWLTLLPAFWILPLAAGMAQELPFFPDLSLRDGRKLSKVQVLKVEPDGIRVEHSAGVGKLGLEVLPSDVAKRFNLTETDAAEWRESEKKRKDEAAAVERQAEVKKVLDAARADQDEQVRQQRLALYQQMRDRSFNYVEADAVLRKTITIYKEAGREDLARLLEDDREVLRQQEVYRPTADLEAEKKKLADRVTQLETDLANARNQPPTIIYTDNTPAWVPSTTIYYNSDPVYVPVPICPPAVPDCPPALRPPGSQPWPATRGPGYQPPATNYPVRPLGPPPTIGPRQPDVRQPNVRQPDVPPISLPQPRNTVPPMRPVPQVPAYRPPTPVYRPAAPAPVYRPASISPARPAYPSGGGGAVRQWNPAPRQGR